MVKDREQLLIDIIRDCIKSWSGDYRTRSYRGTVLLHEGGWADWYDGIVIRGKIEGKSAIYDYRLLKRAKTDRVFIVDLESGRYAMGPLGSFLRDDDAPCPSSFDFNARKGDKSFGVWSIPQGIVEKHVKARQPVQVKAAEPVLVKDTQPTVEVIKPSVKKVINHIYVQFEKEGVHKYPAALTDPKLADVSFLGYPHRHMFKFLVEIEVFHDDRDIEFIQFKRWLESLYNDEVLNLDYRSCEMISDELAGKISERFPGRKIIIEVSEDGENGSRAVYIPA